MKIDMTKKNLLPFGDSKNQDEHNKFMTLALLMHLYIYLFFLNLYLQAGLSVLHQDYL